MSLLPRLWPLLLLASIGCRQANPAVELLESELRWMEDQVYLLDEQLQKKSLELESCRRSNASLKNLLAVQQQSPRSGQQLPERGRDEADAGRGALSSPEEAHGGGAAPNRSQSAQPRTKPRLRRERPSPRAGADPPSLHGRDGGTSELPEPDLPMGGPEIELGPESTSSDAGGVGEDVSTEDLVPPDVDLGNGNGGGVEPPRALSPPADNGALRGSRSRAETLGRQAGRSRGGAKRRTALGRASAQGSEVGTPSRLNLNGRLTGAYDHDGLPGDDGIMVLLQVEPAGAFARDTLGPLELELRDPRSGANYRLVSRWDFDASTIVAHYGKTLFGEGVHLEVPWETVPDCAGELELVARMLTEDGRRLTTTRQVTVHPPGLSGISATSPTARAASRRNAVPAGWHEANAWNADRPRAVLPWSDRVPAEPSLLPDVISSDTAR